MNILLRGDICRGCSQEIQHEAYQSVIKHVIKPLYPICKNINVIVVSYDDKYKEFVEDIFKDYNVFSGY